MTGTRFTWIPAYEAIATALLGYEDRQEELCAIVRDVIGDSYEEMDPLTFFSMFNGKRRSRERRIEAIRKVLPALGIDAEVPSDFEGLPHTNPQQWRFWDGKPGTIEHNWRVFKAAIAFADAPSDVARDEFARFFDIVHAQGNIGDAKLTMALFWARPKRFLPLDNSTRNYIRSHLGVTVPAPLRGVSYVSMLDDVRAATDADFPTVSYDAWRVDVEENNTLGDADVETVGYWTYVPGRGAGMWEEFYGRGVMALGLGELGDLMAYGSKREIRERLRVIHGSDSNFFNSVQCAWQFAHDVKPGDVVFVLGGASEVLGCGIVAGDYVYGQDSGEYPNLRDMTWKHKGFWRTKSRSNTKSLTEITDYPDKVMELKTLFQNVEEAASEDVLAKDATVGYPSYGRSEFLSEVYMDSGQYDTLVNVLRIKKNVVLQGAPGVGKTFAAKRLAYSMMGEKDADRVMMVQFHQSYSYEDFIEGYRPSDEGFELAKGAFYTFCRRAAEDEENDYFFIIDEINRGNLSKIFGELFMLIEADKRGPKYKLQLLYSHEFFHVPKNVYIVGMMNTADRSLAMLDYALRRRFAFFDLRPAFLAEGFVTYRKGLASTQLDGLVSCVERLNDEIADDEALGEGFCIGHSYFCGMEPGEATGERLSAIVEYELVPMLREYWFDEPSKVREWAGALRRSIQ